MEEVESIWVSWFIPSRELIYSWFTLLMIVCLLSCIIVWSILTIAIVILVKLAV